jgi:hypothetical protein
MSLPNSTPLGKNYFYTKVQMIGSAHHEYRIFKTNGTLVGKQVSCPDEGDARNHEFNFRSQAELRRSTAQMARTARGAP